MAHTMEYDGNGNPKSVTTTNSTVTTSEYDEIGRMRTNGFENAAGLLYNYTNGIPAALKQNGNLYYYITNLQGDVIRLVDANGNTAALYKYDPYGNPIHASGSLATINPLRYRGYYYDSETGLYYVSSRY